MKEMMSYLIKTFHNLNIFLVIIFLGLVFLFQENFEMEVADSNLNIFYSNVVIMPAKAFVYRLRLEWWVLG